MTELGVTKFCSRCAHFSPTPRSPQSVPRPVGFCQANQNDLISLFTALICNDYKAAGALEHGDYQKLGLVDLISLVSEVTTIGTIQTLQAITNIANIESLDLVDLITEISNISSVDLIDQITNIANIQSLDLIDLITEITTIQTVNTLSTLSSVTNIVNLESVDLIDAITEIANISSVDLIDQITNIANIQSLDLIDNITNIANLESLDLIDLITEITKIVTVETITEITRISSADISASVPIDIIMSDRALEADWDKAIATIEKVANGALEDWTGGSPDSWTTSSVTEASNTADIYQGAKACILGVFNSGSFLTDAGLELWDDVNNLTNWEKHGTGISTLTRDSSDPRSGTYAADCYFKVIGQAKAVGLRVRALTAFSGYMKKVNGANNISLRLTIMTEGGAGRLETSFNNFADTSYTQKSFNFAGLSEAEKNYRITVNSDSGLLVVPVDCSFGLGMVGGIVGGDKLRMDDCQLDGYTSVTSGSMEQDIPNVAVADVIELSFFHKAHDYYGYPSAGSKYKITITYTDVSTTVLDNRATGATWSKDDITSLLESGKTIDKIKIENVGSSTDAPVVIDKVVCITRGLFDFDTEGYQKVLNKPLELTSYSTGQVTVTTTATKINSGQKRVIEVTLDPDATNPIFIGGSGVTTGTGRKLVAGESVVFSNVTFDIYGIVASGSETVYRQELDD